tara:strand:+ start:305 stop:688 length:384 start_codon:yes stop_codon:yes gene_type:complete
MAEEIELKKAGKAQTANQMRRNAILNSNTKLGNQAAVISPKTNILQRSYMNPEYLTQSPEGLLSMLIKRVGPLGLLGLIGSPSELGDGTLPEGFIKELQALEAQMNATREAEQLAAAKAKLRTGFPR